MVKGGKDVKRVESVGEKGGGGRLGTGRFPME